jgi:apolipoprotein N-acyltransferase
VAARRLVRTLLLDATLLVIGGVLYGAAFPPHACALGAWVTLVPLLAVAARASVAGAFAAGFLYGTVFFWVTVPWVVEAVAAYFAVGLVGAAALGALICVVFVSVYVGGFAIAARALLRRQRWLALVGVPALWVTGELARATLLTGLPWELLGHSQWQSPLLIQVADLGGVYAVSYLVAAVNVGVYLAVRGLARDDETRQLVRACAPLAAALALVAAVLGYGSWRSALERTRAGAPAALVTVVQGNQPPSWTWDRSRAERTLLLYADLSRRAVAATHPDLLVWPEYAVTLYPGADPMVLPALSTLAASVPGGLVFGAPRTAGSGRAARYFNSAFHLTADQGFAAYDKIHLVPFAEYQPLGIGEAVAATDERAFGAGTRSAVFKSAAGRLGVMICYEVVFPELARGLVHAGAEILLNLANDGWMDTAGLGASRQHLSMATFRAVETRRYLVRATTSGVSGFIDPLGRPFGLLGEGERAVTSGVVERRREITPYARYGDLFAVCCGVVGLAALLWSGRRRRSA